MTAPEIIAMLNMRPLPEEGGYYVETYRSDDSLPRRVLPDRYSGDRAVATAIYYLLTPETFSAFHRLASDEIYHFYRGDPVELTQLRPDGTGETLLLGPALEGGMRPQVVVPQGVWQGSRLSPGGRFALLGTTMAPGFDRADYQHGARHALLQAFPAHREIILKLTR